MTRKIRKIRVSAKCSDLCWIGALDSQGNEIAEGDGYVPDFMPGDHYGDYIMLDIDVETGKILDWTAPTDAQIRKDLKGM